MSKNKRRKFGEKELQKLQRQETVFNNNNKKTREMKIQTLDTIFAHLD